MPLPLILGIGAAAAGALGIGTGVYGASKMKVSNDIMKLCQARHEKNLAYFDESNKIAIRDMDILGKKELEILISLKDFFEVFEKIHNRPEFKTYEQNDVTIPPYTAEEIKKVSVGADVLLSGLGGTAVGTAGGIAAAGATTVAVMALGTAFTGTTMVSLSGVTATNAAFAALGGGAIAAGGGGMALGTAALGAGLLAGGIIFNAVGSSLSEKADEAYKQVRKECQEINRICNYLLELSKTAKEYTESILEVLNVYLKQLGKLNDIVNTRNKRDWNDFSEEERLVTENTALLVGLLYNMGKVELVLKSDDSSQANTVNTMAVQKSMSDAKTILFERGFKETDSIDLN